MLLLIIFKKEWQLRGAGGTNGDMGEDMGEDIREDKQKGKG